MSKKDPNAEDPAVGRRKLFGTAAAVAAGVGASMVVAQSPAAAADGDPIKIGALNVGENGTYLVASAIPAGQKALFSVAEQTLDTDYRAVILGASKSGSVRHGVIGASFGSGVGVVAYASAQNSAPFMIVPHAGLPTGGAHAVGEMVNVNGTVYTCVAAGTPGTWASVGFNPVTPFRVLDTRSGAKLQAGDANALTLSVAPNGAVPGAAKAVAYNLTVTQPTAGGWLTVWPNGAARPNASNINFLAGQTVANFATTKVGSGGDIKIYLSGGATHVLVDIAGYYI